LTLTFQANKRHLSRTRGPRSRQVPQGLKSWRRGSHGGVPVNALGGIPGLSSPAQPGRPQRGPEARRVGKAALDQLEWQMTAFKSHKDLGPRKSWQWKICGNRFHGLGWKNF